jgi:hypothetical protein
MNAYNIITEHRDGTNVNAPPHKKNSAPVTQLKMGKFLQT